MPNGKGYKSKMRGGDKKVKGAKLKKNVTGSAAYKQDKKARKKDYVSGGFKFGRKSPGATEENVRASASKSLASSGPAGKNDAAVRKAIQKLEKGKVAKKKTTKATLGNPVITVKKKKRR